MIGGSTDPGRVWGLSDVLSSSFGWFFSWPCVVSSHACAGVYSAKYSWGSSVQLSSHTSLWTLGALVSLDSQVISPMKKSSWLCLSSSNLKTVVGHRRAHWDSLPTLTHHCPSLFAVQGNSCFIYFVCFRQDGRFSLCYIIVGYSGSLPIGFLPVKFDRLIQKFIWMEYS